jgi:hypothetical protein
MKPRSPATNSTYKKLAVLWLNETLRFVSSAVLTDSFRLRNRQLLVAAKRYCQLPCDRKVKAFLFKIHCVWANLF